MLKVFVGRDCSRYTMYNFTCEKLGFQTEFTYEKLYSVKLTV